MIKLLDGPAAGIRLNCRRSPRYLRVVESPQTQETYRCGRPVERSRWDALDKLADEPKPHEVIHVYEWFEYHKDGSVHVDGVRDGRRFGEWRSLSEDRYQHVPLAPEEAERFRDNAAWREWCHARAAAAKGGDQ